MTKHPLFAARSGLQLLDVGHVRVFIMEWVTTVIIFLLFAVATLSETSLAKRATSGSIPLGRLRVLRQVADQLRVVSLLRLSGNDLESIDSSENGALDSLLSDLGNPIGNDKS